MEKREKSVWWTLEGSFTVEVSYLMPLIVFLIWNLLYLSFFLYNQSTAMQGNYCTALRTERMMGNIGEKKAAAEEKYDVSVRKKMVCVNIEDEKEITEEAVTVGTKMEMGAPGGYYFENIWHGEQRQRAEKWQPVHFIRNCRKAEYIKDWLETGDW